MCWVGACPRFSDMGCLMKQFFQQHTTKERITVKCAENYEVYPLQLQIQFTGIIVQHLD